MALFRMKSHYRKNKKKELSYYGTATALPYKMQELAGTSIKNFALFGGGNNASSVVHYNNVEVYNSSLTQSEVLLSFDGSTSAASINNYALFTGGVTNDSSNRTTTHPDVECFDTSLTKHVLTPLDKGFISGAAASNKDYALFIGGNSYNLSVETKLRTVTPYNNLLTKLNTINLPNVLSQHAAISTKNYVLIGGGTVSQRFTDQVLAYDTSLVRSTLSNLSYKRRYLKGGANKKYALFGGGNDNAGSQSGKAVDAYIISSLTKLGSVQQLSDARMQHNSIGFDNYILFAGGEWSSELATVEVYDESLIKTYTNNLSRKRSYLASAVVKDYIIFAGGGYYYNGSKALDNVDVYQVK